MKLKKKSRWWKIILIIVALLLAALSIAGNVLVNIALIPSKMAETEAFVEITRESVDALVKTDDIQQNYARAIEETNQWIPRADAREVQRESVDGYELTAGVFQPKKDTHRWALLLHGYTGWKEEMYPYARKYWEEGYAVVVPDMRCQGESQGDFIGMGYTDSRDNLIWINYILEQDPQAEIVIHGQSMGAACGLIMAGSGLLPDHVKAVVSDCAYTDAYTMFRRQLKSWFHLPSFPLLNAANLMLQLRGGYDLKDASALEGVKNSRIPILLIHGDRDEMIPVDMAYELYEAANCRKELLIVEGAGHAQAPDKDPEKYYGTIFSFLEDSLT